MFHVATGLLGLFTILRLVIPLRAPWVVRILMAVGVMAVSEHHLITRIVFGSMFSPEVSREVMIGANWLFGAILLFFLITMPLDIVFLLRSAWFRRWKFVPGRLRSAVAVGALLLAGIAVGQAVRVPPVKHVEIGVKDLPQELDGFSLVQLTDLHISRLFQAPWVEAVVRDTNALNPDLIVITGDLIDGTLEARREDVEPLRDLRSVHGVLMIPGNHEYYFGYPGWIERFHSLGLQPLVNSHAVIEHRGVHLVVAGVSDAAAVVRGLPGPDVAGAVEGAPAEAPIIVLDHRPTDAAVAARAGVSLQLSGHTHGGLILGFDRFIASFNRGLVSGHYDVEGMPLYVSNGTALWIGFALRLGVPSELTRIVLRRI